MRNLIISVLFSAWMVLPAAALCQSENPAIIVATDLHYLSPALTDNGPFFTRMIESGDGKVMLYCDALVEAFIDEVIEAKPDCLVLSGDITFNGEKRSHEDLAAKLARVREAGIPVLVIPGNHDLNMRASASFSGESYTLVPSITADEFSTIYRAFGFDDALSRDAHSLSYISEPVSGVCIVMLDANTPGAPCAIPAPTFVWLEEQLAAARAAGKKIIAVTHQNLFAHSDLLSAGYVLTNAQKLLALYIKYGVAVNLSGHMHLQHTMRSHSGLPEIATSSLAVAPCQYGVIEIGDDQGSYHTKTLNVSAWAQKTGQTDENLLHFSEYAHRFFTGRSRDQIIAKLGGTADAGSMADFFIDLNYAYFSGRLDTFVSDPAVEALWAKEGKSFFGLYIASMLREPDVNHTQLIFDF